MNPAALKPALLLLALIWLPFVTIFAFANPSLTERVGDSHPHVVYHLLAAGLLVGAILVVRRLRAGRLTRAGRAATAVLLVTLPLAILGNLAELVTAVSRLAEDGWESLLTPDLFEEGAHATAASLTIPSLMLSMVTALTLVVIVALGRRRLEPVR